MLKKIFISFMRSSSDGPRGVWQKGGGGGGSSANITLCIYCACVCVGVCVCVFGRGGQRKKFVCAANKISKICIP